MTPREADIAYALEALDDIEALFAVAAPEKAPGPEKSVEVVIQLRIDSVRAQARVAARFAAYFEGGVPPFVTFVDSKEMSAPRFMHRAVALTLSPSEREDARARQGLRQMRRDANAVAARVSREAATRAARRALRERRASIAIAHRWSVEVERAIAGVDADVRVLPALRGSGPFLNIALTDVDAGEIDLFVVDAQTAWDYGRQLRAAMERRFGGSARDHLLIVETGRPTWASQLMSAYASLSMPFDVARLASILDKATRWRRAEVMEWDDAE
jgi:hypothetical protein